MQIGYAVGADFGGLLMSRALSAGTVVMVFAAAWMLALFGSSHFPAAFWTIAVWKWFCTA